MKHESKGEDVTNILFKQCNPTNYGSGRTQAIEFLVIHYTANNGDSAAGNASYFAGNKNLNASAHYFVDESDAMYQSIKDADTAWHCGAVAYKHPFCRNANSIGIELCSRKNSSGEYYFQNETMANAIHLTQALMDKYGIPVDNVVRHYDVTGKNCPAPFVHDSWKWDDFKNRLTTKQEEDEMRYSTVDEIPDYAKKTIQKLMEKGYLSGRSSGLDLSLDMIRIFVVNDMAGLYDSIG